MLAESGDDRGGLALSESAKIVGGRPSDVVGWMSVYVTARPVRRMPSSISLATDHSGLPTCSNGRAAGLKVCILDASGVSAGG